TKFEDRCLIKIASYLSRSPGNYKNKRYITRLIKREVKDAHTLYKNEFAELFSTLATRQENEEEEIEFEPIDILANVESELLKKETAALLAKDDCKRELVLQAWSDGNTNDASI